MNVMKTGLLVLQALAFGCSSAADDSDSNSWVRLVMDGQAIEFLDGNGQHGGDSSTGPYTFIHGFPVAPEDRKDNYLQMYTAGVEPGTWTYDSSAPTGGGYPQIDLQVGGTLYRGYPRIPLAGTEPEPVKFTISVMENGERIRGTFFGVLSQVDERLHPSGAVATVMKGEFDVAFLQPTN